MFELKPDNPWHWLLSIYFFAMYAIPAAVIIWVGYAAGGAISERFSDKKSTTSTVSDNKSKGASIGAVVTIIILIAIIWVEYTLRWDALWRDIKLYF